MKKATLIAAAVLLIAATGSAQAVKMTNRDAVDHKITVKEGEKKTQLTIKAGEEITLCDAGCSVEIESGEEFELTGTEIVSYEDNFLYDDSPAPEDGGGMAGDGDAPADGMEPADGDKPADGKN
jgi:hypothetical protein